MTLANYTPPLLIALWLVWAGFLFGGFFFGKANLENTRRMPTGTRMASSVTLVIAGWLWWLFALNAPGSVFSTFAFWIATGMTLGCIGDFFMANLIPVKDHVLGGIISFGLGHIAYIIGFVIVGNTLTIPEQPAIIIVWLMIAGILWYLVVFHSSQKTFLHYAALPYALLLAATTGLATMRGLQSSIFLPAAVGTALFLLSDLILATRLFNQAKFQLIDDVIWLLYGPGQMLIVFSIPVTLTTLI